MSRHRCVRQSQREAQAQHGHKLADELMSHARSAFELQRGRTEPYDIKYALSDGREQLKRLRETFLMQQ